MSIILYELAGADPALRFSPHCWKVRMALAHKGLEAEYRPWYFTDKETIAFSGQSSVPILLDSDETICDSWRIALHLEARYPNESRLLAGLDAVPLTQFVNSWADNILMPAIARIIVLDVHDCLIPADRKYFRVTREKLLGKSLEATAADHRLNLSALMATLTPLRHLLRERNFLSGAEPAYADYCVFGMFMWAHCCSSAEILEDGDPVFSWRERLLDAFGGLARSANRFQSLS